MAKRKFARLQRIDNDHRITEEVDGAFLHALQNSLLLSLKEQGRLNEMQYRNAAERLNAHQRKRTRERTPEEEGD